MAIVLDCASEFLLVIFELNGSQAFVFEGLSSDNVNGRLLFPSTVTEAVLPLDWDKKTPVLNKLTISLHSNLKPDFQMLL